MIESAVMDLPDPDSPTSAKVVPRSMEKLTPLTAVTVAVVVWKQVCKLLIERRGGTESLITGGT